VAAYGYAEVRGLVEHYAVGAAYLQGAGSGRKDLAARLLDLDIALAQLPEPAFEILTLRGLQDLDVHDTAEALAISQSAVTRRYRHALEQLATLMNEPPRTAPTRTDTGWWEWVQQEPTARETSTRTAAGRPVQTGQAVEERIVVLACAGTTQREIAKAEGVPRATVQSVLRRYAVPKPPRGQRPKATNYSAGQVSRPDYPLLMGEGQYCAPAELIRAYRDSMPAD
jgi:DNA-directed RNA polymerase specialized sigma24 family protein